jgi:hypothetical protein
MPPHLIPLPEGRGEIDFASGWVGGEFFPHKNLLRIRLGFLDNDYHYLFLD